MMDVLLVLSMQDTLVLQVTFQFVILSAVMEKSYLQKLVTMGLRMQSAAIQIVTVLFEDTHVLREMSQLLLCVKFIVGMELKWDKKNVMIIIYQLRMGAQIYAK